MTESSVINSTTNGRAIADYHEAGSIAGIAESNSKIVDVQSSGGAVEALTIGGGLVGKASDVEIVRSWSDAIVDVSQEESGGIVGVLHSPSRIEDSYATGAVEGGSAVGGLVGKSEGDTETSYAANTIVSGSPSDGLVGTSTASSTVTYSYWDKDRTGQSGSAGGTALTTEEMTGSDAETNMTGFDFNSIWKTVPSDYPELRDNEEDD